MVAPVRQLALTVLPAFGTFADASEMPEAKD
jgi:hypothetical protein